MPSRAAAVAAPEPSTAVLFSLQARAEPGVMPRVLELFAKRGLVPERWQSAVVSRGAGLTIDIAIAGLDGDAVDYLASCLRQIVGVELVLMA